jgi:hypothetical protein
MASATRMPAAATVLRYGCGSTNRVRNMSEDKSQERLTKLNEGPVPGQAMRSIRSGRTIH